MSSQRGLSCEECFVFVGLALSLCLWVGGLALSYCGVQNHLFIVVLGPPQGIPFVCLFFCIFVKELLLKAIPFLFLFPFVFGVGFVFWTLCPGAARESQAVRAA